MAEVLGRENDTKVGVVQSWRAVPTTDDQAVCDPAMKRSPADPEALRDHGDGDAVPELSFQASPKLGRQDRLSAH